MDRFLLVVIRGSVTFALFFLTLYLGMWAGQTTTDSDTPMLSSADVLMIGGMFVLIGILTLIVYYGQRAMSAHRAKESVLSRLEEIGGG